MRFGIRLAILLVFALCLGERPARACGAFPSVTWVKAPPRLSLERTLIVWDSGTKIQHIVRELRFAHAAGAFGFVVPTPSRPSVHAVEASPFDELDARFDSRLVERFSLSLGSGFGAGLGGTGQGRAAEPPPVQVVEKKRVGDFTAFVLTATDPNALAAWLDKHGFATSPASKAWMDGYVKLGFHFVALRYDGTKDADEEMTSRTLRISFQSELPFYPYREPADAPEQTNRELALWVVSDVPLVPYAGVTHQAEWRLRRPFSEGLRAVPVVGELEETLGKELSGLLPRTRFVQTFGDFKPHRRGFEDVVFVPLADCDDACRSARERLVPWLDPSQREPAPAAPAPLPSANALSCAAAPRAGGHAFWLLAAGALCLRRRRWLALVPLAALAFGCERSAPAPAPAPSASAAASAAPSASVGFPAPPPAFVAPRDPAARKQALLDVLANRFDGYVPVWSLPAEGGMGAARSEHEAPWPEGAALASECAPGIEAAVTLEADVDAKGSVKAARVIGPLPKRARECLERVTRGTMFSPEGGERTERTHAYFGEKSPEAERVSRSIKSARRRFVPMARPRLRLADTKVSEGLPPEVVQRVLRQRFSMLFACYGQRALRSPSGTRVLLRLDIDAEGSPTNVQAIAKHSPALGSCVLGAIQPMRFPKPTRAPVRVSTELVFSSD